MGLSEVVAFDTEFLFGLNLGRNHCFWKNTNLAIFWGLILNGLLYSFCNQLLHLWRAGETNFYEDVCELEDGFFLNRDTGLGNLTPVQVIDSALLY